MEFESEHFCLLRKYSAEQDFDILDNAKLEFTKPIKFWYKSLYILKTL